MNQNNFGGIDEILKYLGYDRSSGSFNFNQNSFQNNNNNNSNANASDRTADQDFVNPIDLRRSDNSRSGSRRRDNRRRRSNSRDVRNNPDSANRLQMESSSGTGGNNADTEEYQVDIDPTGGAANNCCINQNLDIPCGFQDINPTVFIILGEVVGDLLSGQLPFNVANAVANWLNLIGQVIETYATQQVYSESGPGRYYSPLYKNVANPFCTCTEAANNVNSNSQNAGSSSGSSNSTSTDNNDANRKAVTKNNEDNTTDNSFNTQENSTDNIEKDLDANNSSKETESQNNGITGGRVSNCTCDNKENLRKSIERIDNEISDMKKQFSIFNKKMEELKKNINNTR